MTTKVGFRRKNTQSAIDNAPTEGRGSNGVTRANEWGLTEKQEGYARDVAKGSTLVSAYRNNYDCSGMSESTTHNEASKLLDNPRVAARIKRLIDDANARHQVDAARIRRHVMDNLLKESIDMDSPASARISALVALGKIDVVGMFKEHKGDQNKDDVDPDRLKTKLRGLLEEMTGIAPPIKGD